MGNGHSTYAAHLASDSYMSQFLGVVLSSSTLISMAYGLYVIGITRAVRVIHSRLINTVLHATLR